MEEFSAEQATSDAPEVLAGADVQTPTTPKPANTIVPGHSLDAAVEESIASTPTRHNFGGAESQLLIPDDPFITPQKPNESSDAQNTLKRDSSTRSSASQLGEPGDDVEMGEGEDNDAGEDDGSDNDSVTSDSQRPSKKKKGQRFFCTEFPPCTLSFTRSEHLARHIRYASYLLRWDLKTDFRAENIPVNDLSNATAREDSLGWTTYGSMLRLST